ncbi:MAG TPA: hypothetical protein VF746_14305 [Longimicrobium sp.]|jgi:hypothetical protein
MTVATCQDRRLPWYFAATAYVYAANGLVIAGAPFRSAGQCAAVAVNVVVFVAFTAWLALGRTGCGVPGATLLSGAAVLAANAVVKSAGLLGVPGIVVWDTDPPQVVASAVFDLVLWVAVTTLAAGVVAVCARLLSWLGGRVLSR